MARRKQEEAKPGAPLWLATYGDMMTLCLCFFVLLFAMSTVDAQKFKAVAESLEGALGVFESGPTVSVVPNDNDYPNDIPADEGIDYRELYEDIKSKLDEKGLQNSVTLVLNERGLLIRFLDNVLFPSGSAELKSDSTEIIDMIADVVKKNDNNVRIEGHTDNVPIRTGKFPSNWELSTTRAVNVVRYLIEVKGIAPDKLSAAGYGEYHPIEKNDNAAGREKNRRVDIVVLRINESQQND